MAAAFAAWRQLYDGELETYAASEGTPAIGAVAEGRVIDAETGEVVKWRPSPMVLPVSDKLARRLRQAAEPAPPVQPSKRTLRLR